MGTRHPQATFRSLLAVTRAARDRVELLAATVARAEAVRVLGALFRRGRRCGGGAPVRPQGLSLRRQAGRRRPADLTAQMARDGFVTASVLDLRTANAPDALAVEVAHGFEAVLLSPLAPLGCCSVVAPSDSEPCGYDGPRNGGRVRSDQRHGARVRAAAGG
jgi:hypothetical protein